MSEPLKKNESNQSIEELMQFALQNQVATPAIQTKKESLQEIKQPSSIQNKKIEAKKVVSSSETLKLNTSLGLKAGKIILWIDGLSERFSKILFKTKENIIYIWELRTSENFSLKFVLSISTLGYLISSTLFFSQILNWPIQKGIVFYFESKRLMQTEAYIKEQQRRREEEIAKKAIYFNKENLIEDILGSIKAKDGSKHYISLSFYIEPHPPKLLNEEIRPKMPIIKESILNVLELQILEDVTTKEGKEKLKEKLKASIDLNLKNGHIKELYFDNFVVK